MDITDKKIWLKAIKSVDKLLFSKDRIEQFNATVNKNIFSSSKENIPGFGALISSLRTLTSRNTKVDISSVETEMRNAFYTDEFALTINRTAMRALPIKNFLFSGEERDIDRMQETGLEIGEALRILLKGKRWAYAESPFYSGWVKLADIAIGDKETVERFANAKEFFVVTGNYVYTIPSINKNISMRMFGMGAKLVKAESGSAVSGEVQTVQRVVKLPVKKRGKLAFESALISYNADVSNGYLAPTRRNILEEALKLVGERYGWGDSFGARDCSSTMRSIYETMGILLPRDAKEQEKISLGKRVDFSQMSTEEKLKALDKFQLGDLLFMKGHVMMYFGKVNGTHYIFHNFHRTYANGRSILVNSALITPIDVPFSAEKTALSEIRTGIVMEE